ncbi:hypothetical protein HY625_01230 [Candidatus Uhrbacteria bacterium]|nr:hypothetical protein [Candidatus Uhrbacteria bacterium]
MYTKVVTRFPNFEVGFFAALLEYFEWVRRKLEVTRGALSWEFIPAGGLQFSKYVGKKPADLAADGKLLFNVGEGAFDQHGRPENIGNANGGMICSGDVLRMDGYDFLGRRAYLTRLYEIVAANDVSGVSVSGDKENFREAMVGLTAKYQEKPEVVLEFLTLGFCGLFELARNGEELADPYARASLERAVLAYAPEKADRFRTLYQEAMNCLIEEWNRAVADYGSGRRERRISHPEMGGRQLKVVSFRSGSCRAGHVARRNSADVTIIQNPDGHVQVTARILFLKGGKKRLNLGYVAAALRKEEAYLLTTRLEEDVTKVGFFGNGMIIPWYFAEFLTMVANGTVGNNVIPVTKIPIGRILELVIATLPTCVLFEREEDKKKPEPVMAPVTNA